MRFLRVIFIFVAICIGIFLLAACGSGGLADTYPFTRLNRFDFGCRYPHSTSNLCSPSRCHPR